jgi:hypothetical protein
VGLGIGHLPAIERARILAAMSSIAMVCRRLCLSRARRHGVEAQTSSPLYTWSNAERTGYDFAIVRLDGPIDDAGPPPALYGGNREDGARIVMVGWGSRGIGSVGQKPKYYTLPGKAAR